MEQVCVSVPTVGLIEKRPQKEEQKKKRKWRNKINNNKKKLYCAAIGVALWHAVKETLEEEEGMDFGVWHLQKEKKNTKENKKGQTATLRIQAAEKMRDKPTD